MNKYWQDDYMFLGTQRRYAGDDGLVFLGDCRDILLRFPPATVDLVVTDAPYGISNRKRKRTAFRNGIPSCVNYADWDCFDSEIAHANYMNLRLSAVNRACKPGASLYLWYDRRAIWKPAWALWFMGWSYKGKLYGVKRNPAPRWRQYNWNSCVQECLYMVKRTTKANTFNFSKHHEMFNKLEYSVGSNKPIHPTQKQPALIEPLVRVSSKPGDLVLDPFAGSCETLIQARAHGCRFIGIEKDAKVLRRAVRRLRRK